MKRVTKLGEGAYGSVYSCQYKDQNLAIKRNSLDNRVDFCGNLKELDMLITLRGYPYVIPLRGVSFSSPFSDALSPLREKELRNDDLYFILDKAETDLHDLIYKRLLTFSQYKTILVQSLLALEFLHAKGIIHRDIKPSNILWSKDAIKICDFGLSKPYTYQGIQTPRVITAWYRSPEVFVGSYNYKADIWSLGCVLIECLAERPLFKGTETEIYKSIKLFNAPREIITSFIDFPPQKITKFGGEKEYEELLSLLFSMLSVNAEKRPTASECLEFPFCQRQKALISDIRSKFPPRKEKLPLLNIISCFEREKAVSLVNDIYNNRDEFNWYSPRVLFLSISIFDRYLDYMYQKYPQGLKKEGEEGRYHSERGVILRYLVCLYMAVKYYSSLYVPESFLSFTGNLYKKYLVPEEEIKKSMRDFERILIQQVCRYRIYSPTPYEEADVILSPDQERLLLYYYGAIGTCKTNSKKIFTSWKTWSQK